MSIQPPILYDLKIKRDLVAFEKLVQQKSVHVIDRIDQQLDELFSIRNPQYIDSTPRKEQFLQDFTRGKDKKFVGVWAYFPWKQSVIHLLAEDEYYAVRTARNFPLISLEEQEQLKGLCVGIVGLSVGSSVLSSLLHLGVGRHFKLADFDLLELSNLNRVRASIFDLGEKKSQIAARYIYELNPFAVVEVFEEGLQAKEFKAFFEGTRSLDLLFDECDDLPLKFYLRLAARSLSLPLFMASDIGFTAESSALRFDLNPDAGKMKEVPKVEFDVVVSAYTQLEDMKLSIEEKILLIVELLGEESISDEMKQAILLRASNQITSFPQLGPIAFLAGGFATLAVLTAYRFPVTAVETASINLLKTLATPSESEKIQSQIWSKQFRSLLKKLNSTR